jgi:hypothetical protein
MNIGMTQNAIGQYRDAVDSIRSEMAELPANQQNAEWLEEYQQALDHAAGHSDEPPTSPPDERLTKAKARSRLTSGLFLRPHTGRTLVLRANP